MDTGIQKDLYLCGSYSICKNQYNQNNDCQSSDKEYLISVSAKHNQ